MHGYKWPINFTRTRMAAEAAAEEEKAAKEVRSLEFGTTDPPTRGIRPYLRMAGISLQLQ